MHGPKIFYALDYRSVSTFHRQSRYGAKNLFFSAVEAVFHTWQYAVRRPSASIHAALNVLKRGWSLLPGMSTRWSPDVLATVTDKGSMTDRLLFLVCSGSITSRLFTRSEKYLMWKTRTSWSKRVRSFPFLNRLFYPDTYRTSLWHRYWFLKHIFSIFTTHVYS